ncbi:MAG TPA: hypothetical protein VNO30_48885 [Kofleriaceae bacterium]|nr:hypothetical protein [Kofleriaceae bacterium]
MTALWNVEDSDQRATSTHANQTPQYQQTSKQIVVQASPGRLEALEKEVEHLRNERNEHNERNERNERNDPPVTEIQNPEEERKRVEAQFGELERHLLADPVDPSWSGGAAELLRNDLSGITGKDGFNLVTVECRTEMCRATLQWENYEAAVKTGMRLPERAIPGLNCAKSIWLKEPENPAGSYSSSLYLDCSEQRAGIADIIR